MKKTYGYNNPVEVEFKGLENVNEIFEKLPSKYAKKPILATLRKGARIFVRDLRSVTPRKTGNTRKAIGIKNGKGISISVGFRTTGSYFPAWSKAYWMNYGTLSNRDGSHHFIKARKPGTQSWRGGIRPLVFVESSWNRTQSQVDKTIMAELQNETVKFLDKYAVK